MLSFYPGVPSIAGAPPVVLLIKTARDRSVAILVVAASARFAPGGFDAWGVLPQLEMEKAFVR
jgi:hypothetical protein